MSEQSSFRYHAFLSHSSPDKPAIEELARRLEKEGIDCFLDKWHLIPGELWQPALEQALQESECCVVAIGPSGLGPWQNEEMRAAISRRVNEASRFRVIPVLLPGAERVSRSQLPPFLVAVTWVEFRETLADEAAFHRLKCGIRGVRPEQSPGDAPFEGECPYRGLEVFDTPQARFFFGRDAQVDWLLDRFSQHFGTPQESRFLGVVGASGSGKSSLVRAGLIPALQEGQSRTGKRLAGSAEWPIVIFKPGSEPLKALADSLWASEVSRPVVTDSLGFADQLLSDERRLHATIGTALSNAPAERRFVIVVDQFEELFTLCPPQAEEQRQAFIDNLLYAATISGGRTIVLITMRADFYGKCSRYQQLAHALSEGQELVPPLGDDELRAAIVRPAQLCGLELEPGLVDLLLQGMRAQPAGALPLLQQALLMLWQKRQGRRLTVQAYREIGEIEGAIEAHANQLYTQRMQNDDQRAICRRVLLMLTNPGEGTEDTRRRVARSQLGENPAVESVLDVLVKGRLITISDSDPPQVEVTHEALIRGWGELREWIDEDRESLRTLQQLIDAAEVWDAKGRDPAYLYQGSRLAQAEEWRAAHAAELADLPVAMAFIAAAVEQRDSVWRNELKTKRRLRRQLYLVGFLLFCVFSVTWGTTIFYDASVILDSDEQAVRGAVFSKDESRLLSWGRDGTAKLWDLTKDEPLRTFDHYSAILGATFSEDESRVLTWSKDGRAKLWDVTKNEPRQYFHHDLRGVALVQSVLGATFNKDESRVLTWGRDGTAKLWDVTKNEPLRTFDHGASVRGATFSKDESRLLTWGNDGTTKLWDVAKAEPLRTFPPGALVRNATFSKDESRMLTLGNDGSTKLWDITKEEPLRTFSHVGHRRGVEDEDDSHNTDEGRTIGKLSTD